MFYWSSIFIRCLYFVWSPNLFNIYICSMSISVWSPNLSVVYILFGIYVLSAVYICLASIFIGCLYLFGVYIYRLSISVWYPNLSLVYILFGSKFWSSVFARYLL